MHRLACSHKLPPSPMSVCTNKTLSILLCFHMNANKFSDCGRYRYIAQLLLQANIYLFVNAHILHMLHINGFKIAIKVTINFIVTYHVISFQSILKIQQWYTYILLFTHASFQMSKICCRFKQTLKKYLIPKKRFRIIFCQPSAVKFIIHFNC